MKVFILGGYGAVGIQSAKLLAGSDLVTEIALAGRNIDRKKIFLIPRSLSQYHLTCYNFKNFE
jgi:hypothetical protein